MGKMETDFFEETQKHLNHMTNIKNFTTHKLEKL